MPLTVTVIDLSCTEALIKGHDNIVVLWKGVFFDAVKQLSDTPGKTLRLHGHPEQYFRFLNMRVRRSCPAMGGAHAVITADRKSVV